MDLCKFLFQQVIYSLKFTVDVVCTGSVNIYLNVSVSLLVPVCPVCLSVFVISNQSTSKKYAVAVSPSINFMPYCIKHKKVHLV